MSATAPNPFSQILFSRPMPARDLLRSPGQSPISWEIVVPARRRERVLEGVFVGCGVAESIAQWVASPHRKTAQRAIQRLRATELAAPILPGHRFHSMVFTTQALLRSRANIDFFARLLRRRLAFYQWSRPFFYIYHQVDRLVRAGTGSGLNCSLGNDPLPRSAILSAVLQGHSHGGLRWVHRSTVSTHPDTMVAHAAMLVSVAVQGAQLTGSEFEISRDELISLLYRTTTIPDLQERLKALASLLSEDGSLEAAAELLGFSQAANPCLVDSALLGIYAWLRYRGNYRRSVEEVSMLGGDTVSAAVVAGSLAGAELGVDAIPKDWLAQTAMQPYDRVWRERFIERLRDWPHGPEDIQRTRTLPSMPVRQVLRNLRYAWWWGTLPVRRIVSG